MALILQTGVTSSMCTSADDLSFPLSTNSCFDVLQVKRFQFHLVLFCDNRSSHDFVSIKETEANAVLVHHLQSSVDL